MVTVLFVLDAQVLLSYDYAKCYFCEDLCLTSAEAGGIDYSNLQHYGKYYSDGTSMFCDMTRVNYSLDSSKSDLPGCVSTCSWPYWQVTDMLGCFTDDLDTADVICEGVYIGLNMRFLIVISIVFN